MTYMYRSVPSKHPRVLGIHGPKNGGGRRLGAYMEKPFVHIVFNTCTIGSSKWGGGGGGGPVKGGGGRWAPKRTNKQPPPTHTEVGAYSGHYGTTIRAPPSGELKAEIVEGGGIHSIAYKENRSDTKNYGGGVVTRVGGTANQNVGWYHMTYLSQSVSFFHFISFLSIPADEIPLLHGGG